MMIRVDLSILKVDTQLRPMHICAVYRNVSTSGSRERPKIISNTSVSGRLNNSRCGINVYNIKIRFIDSTLDQSTIKRE